MLEADPSESVVLQSAVDPSVRLSRRQAVAVRYLANGYSAGSAAVALGLSVRTVTQYLALARARLGARNAPHLVALAFAHGFVRSDDLQCGSFAGRRWPVGPA